MHTVGLVITDLFVLALHTHTNTNQPQQTFIVPFENSNSQTALYDEPFVLLFV